MRTNRTIKYIEIVRFINPIYTFKNLQYYQLRESNLRLLNLSGNYYENEGNDIGDYRLDIVRLLFL